MDTDTTLFEIAKPASTTPEEDAPDEQVQDVSSGRFVRYQFTPQVDDQLIFFN